MLALALVTGQRRGEFFIPVPLVDQLRRSVFLRIAQQRPFVRVGEQRVFIRVT